MGYLRRISTRRLLALCAAVVALAVGLTAIALAAGGGGAVPPPKPLAQAIHDALTAPPAAGISARISYTNRLVDSSLVQGSDPLLSGASGRLWAAGDRLRIELQSDSGAGDSQLLLNGRALSVYDATAGTVYRMTLPPDREQPSGGVPSLARIQQALTRLMRHAVVSAAQPGDVGGRPAYTVRLAPRQDGGMIGAGEIAWDAEHGEPLRLAAYAAGNSTPVLELTASDVSVGPVPASVFDVAPPAGTKVVDLSPREPAGGGHRGKDVSGVAAVQAQLPFPLAAPATLAGMQRSDVRLVGGGKDAAALVTYGRDLSGFAVLESTPSAPQPQGGDGGAPDGLSLPTVQIGGSRGQELATALGTVVRFERGGIAYTVLGSVPPAVAEAAARGL